MQHRVLLPGSPFPSPSQRVVASLYFAAGGVNLHALHSLQLGSAVV